MPSKLKTLAIVVALAAGTSGVALAQGYTCPAGYVYAGGVCQPTAYAPTNPVSGAAQGAAYGAAAGGAAGGPVGALVGGAVGTATGAVTGAANTAAGIAPGYPSPAYGTSYPPPAYGTGYPPPSGCAQGYYWSNGACYPAR
jgi:hypothetical protein